MSAPASVIDTSALLVVIRNETGRDAVNARLPGGVISVVNVAETAGVLVREGATPEGAMGVVESFGLAWAVPDAAQMRRVAELARLRHVALGDRFCIALGEALGRPLVTADRRWATLDLATPVELVR